MKLSTNFSLAEATVSETAIRLKIDNSPNAEHKKAMEFTASKMEKVRELLGNRPIKVNSWYRSAALNKAIPGSSATSQHSKGQAVDFTCNAFGSPAAICKELIKNKELLGYDQLILEPTWVHISFVSKKPRGSELTLIGPGKYSQGIA